MWFQRRLLSYDICTDEWLMDNYLTIQSDCNVIKESSNVLEKKALCVFLNWDLINGVEIMTEALEKYPFMFNGEYSTKCGESNSWKIIGQRLSKTIKAGFKKPSHNCSSNDSKWKTLEKSNTFMYNLYIVSHKNGRHLSAYFEEPKCATGREHFVFDVVSWASQREISTFTQDTILNNIFGEGTPGWHANPFKFDVVEDVIKFSFPLGQMHKTMALVPKEGDMWDILDNSCSAKIFQLVKSAFAELKICDLDSLSPFYTPSVIFQFLKDLANKVSNGKLLTKQERNSIVKDAYTYSKENWANTFDEPLMNQPVQPEETDAANKGD